MITTLREHLINRFHKNYLDGKQDFVNAQVIEDIMHPITNRKHETIGRELRRMAEDGLLERKEMKIPPYKVSSVYYKYIPKKITQIKLQFKD